MRAVLWHNGEHLSPVQWVLAVLKSDLILIQSPHPLTSTPVCVCGLHCSKIVLQCSLQLCIVYFVHPRPTNKQVVNQSTKLPQKVFLGRDDFALRGKETRISIPWEKPRWPAWESSLLFDFCRILQTRPPVASHLLGHDSVLQGCCQGVKSRNTKMTRECIIITWLYKAEKDVIPDALVKWALLLSTPRKEPLLLSFTLDKWPR